MLAISDWLTYISEKLVQQLALGFQAPSIDVDDLQILFHGCGEKQS